MIQWRDIRVLFLLTFFFTGIIFLFDSFFTPLTISREEVYIEPVLPDNFSSLTEETIISSSEDSYLPESSIGISPDILEYFRQKAQKNKFPLIEYIFSPDDFEPHASSYKKYSDSILLSSSFSEYIKDIKIAFFKNTAEIRGKMKDKTIKMFGVSSISYEEYISVFIHELSHYIDIYTFAPNTGDDISERFYSISWDSTTIINAGQTQSDFVSGYAMTNKYEDFAESFTYYVLHNTAFLVKAENSEILKKKYDFFSEIFGDKFIGYSFSESPGVQEYYWDITKIPINIEKFLQYL